MRIVDILGLTPMQRANLYKAHGIEKVTIDGIEFTDYSAFSFIWEKSYVKSPTRSGDGTIGNLNSYSTFLTPHLKIDFSLMSIDSYRALMNLLYSKNEFVVTCYDVVFNTLTTNKMYFSTEEMPKLFTIVEALNGNENAIELLAVQEYTVEMVGTNASIDLISLLYYDKDDNLIGSIENYEGVEVVIGQGVSVPTISGFVFDGKWERVGTNLTYLNNDAYRVDLRTTDEKDSRTISFKAVYKESKTHSLALSYGLGNPYKDIEGKEIINIPFVKGDTVGNALSKANIKLWEGGNLTILPVSDNPTIKEKKGETEVAYTTHERQGWYETATKGNNSSSVTNSTVLNFDRDLVIYQIFAPVRKNVTYNSNGGQEYSGLANVEYGTYVPLPTPYKEGFVFDGWYKDKELSQKFGGTMPPYNITLYAKWVNKK